MSNTPIFDQLVDDLEDWWKYQARFDLCSHCRGYGLVYGYMGEPTDCYHCGGSGEELARDARGRFTNQWESDMYAQKRDLLEWLRGPHYTMSEILTPNQARIYWSPVISTNKSYSAVKWTEVTGQVANLEFRW